MLVVNWVMLYDDLIVLAIVQWDFIYFHPCQWKKPNITQLNLPCLELPTIALFIVVCFELRLIVMLFFSIGNAAVVSH